MKMMLLPAILFLISKHPLTLTITLLIQSTFIATLTSFWSDSWLGLIMFIIMSGGVLVMFIYIASISFNMSSAEVAVLAQDHHLSTVQGHASQQGNSVQTMGLIKI